MMMWAWSWIPQLSGAQNAQLAFVLFIVLVIAAGVWKILPLSIKRKVIELSNLDLNNFFNISLLFTWFCFTISIILYFINFYIYDNKLAHFNFSHSNKASISELDILNTVSLGPRQEIIDIISFQAVNNFDREIKIEDARIISEITGKTISANIRVDNGYASVDEINLVPSGATIHLFFFFGGGPDTVGIVREDFLKQWSKVTLYLKANDKEFRKKFNESIFVPFFPGYIGPRVTVKDK